jgi:GDP-D-mannose dehydratase
MTKIELVTGITHQDGYYLAELLLENIIKYLELFPVHPILILIV